MPTLKVTVGDQNRLDKDTRRRIQAAQEEADLDDGQPVLNFGSYAVLSRLLSPKNLELLAVIFEHEPESIREAPDLGDRDFKQVHRNLSELEDIGVIEFEGGGHRTVKEAEVGLRRSRNRPALQ